MDYYLSMKAKRSSHYIEVKESRVMVKIPIDTILYTDYFNHYIQIHLADRIVKTYMRFEDFSKLLLCYPQFISCYRNCIINLDKVVRLEKTSFVLTSGEHLPITRSLRLQIHQQYADYQFRKINGGIE
jgi:DNA-binding LytR/AlgR family response regulator